MKGADVDPDDGGTERRLSAVPATAPTSPDDHDLMATIARGDEVAFAELYDRMASVVYGVIRKVVRDASQSEEVTQEVFVEIWRTASRFDADRGSTRSWPPAWLMHVL